MLPWLRLLVGSKRLRDRKTMSLIELSWTARNIKEAIKFILGIKTKHFNKHCHGSRGWWHSLIKRLQNYHRVLQYHWCTDNSHSSKCQHLSDKKRDGHRGNCYTVQQICVKGHHSRPSHQCTHQTWECTWSDRGRQIRQRGKQDDISGGILTYLALSVQHVPLNHKWLSRPDNSNASCCTSNLINGRLAFWTWIWKNSQATKLRGRGDPEMEGIHIYNIYFPSIYNYSFGPNEL